MNLPPLDLTQVGLGTLAAGALVYVGLKAIDGTATKAGKSLWPRLQSFFRRQPPSAPPLAPQPVAATVNAQPGSHVVIAGQVAQIADARSPQAPHLHHGNLLPPFNDKFAGRAPDLQRLHAALAQTSTVGVTQTAAAHGEGGVGKTALALHYAWTHQQHYPGGVWWMSADKDLLVPELAALAPWMGVEPGETDLATATLVRAHLQQMPQPALLVLDDVTAARWRDQDWRKPLPTSGACRLLITTRAPALPGARMEPVARLSRREGTDLLAGYRADAGDPAQVERVGDLVDWFDGLPVALTVVAAYMALQPSATWVTLAGHLEQKGLGPVLRDLQDEAGPLPDYHKRIEAIFGDLLDLLSEAERVTLEFAALLPEDVVPLPWLAWLLHQTEDAALGQPHAGVADAADPVLRHLLDRQLLRPIEPAPVHAMHRLLCAFVRERLDGDPARCERRVEGLVALGEKRGKASHGAVTDPSRRWELSSLLALSQVLVNCGRIIAAASVANWVHTPLSDLGRYAEDSKSLERFVTAAGHGLGAAHDKEGAISLNNYALALLELGDLAGARARMEQTITIEEKLFPADDPTLAISYSNLASVQADLDHPAGARASLEQAVAIGEKHFAADSPMLAIMHSNLATVLHGLGNLAGARAHIDQAIAIDEKHLAADHPALAVSYSNLALVLHDLGELHAARARMEQAIAIEEKHFAADHPSFAICYSNLALVLRDLGDLPGARKAFNRALAIGQARLGPDHPTTRTIATNLARLDALRPPR